MTSEKRNIVILSTHTIVTGKTYETGGRPCNVLCYLSGTGTISSVGKVEVSNDAADGSWTSITESDIALSDTTPTYAQGMVTTYNHIRASCSSISGTNAKFVVTINQ